MLEPARDDPQEETTTSGEPSTGLDRAYRWLTVAAIPFAAYVVFESMYQPISDPDTFWHLRLGDYLLDTWRFSGPEPWSSLASQPLVLHEWAPELAYVAAYRLGGYASLAWIQAVGAVALLLTLYLCSRRFAPALVAAIVAIIGYGGASGSVAARPQLVSFFLAAVFTTAWMQTARDRRARWWLIPLSWVWACSHGMWFVGAAIGTVVIIGMLLDRTVALRSAIRLALVPLLSVAVAALTPVGPGLLLTAGNMSGYTKFVREWDPPTVFQHQSLMTLGLAVVIVVMWLRTPGRTPWTDFGLWTMGAAFALMYNRTIALGAVVLTLLAASVLAQRVSIGVSKTPSRRLEASVLVFGTLFVFLLGPTLSSADVSLPGRTPLALEKPLQALPGGTVVYNDYALGGWLLWAHPDLDPVIDGRADVYDVDYFQRTLEATAMPPDWETTVRRSGATAALLPTDSPLVEGLQGRLGWTPVGVDKGYVLLVPRQGGGS